MVTGSSAIDVENVSDCDLRKIYSSRALLRGGRETRDNLGLGR